MREQRLRDSTTRRGHADKVEHHVPMRAARPPAELPPAAFRFSEKSRVGFACKGLQNVAQGSFRIEAALAVLAHLTRVQAAHGVKGAIGEERLLEAAAGEMNTEADGEEKVQGGLPGGPSKSRPVRKLVRAKLKAIKVAKGGVLKKKSLKKKAKPVPMAE